MADKKPLSSKSRTPAVFGLPSFFQNKLQVSQTIIDDITKSGKEYRWINHGKYLKDGNIHQNGWVVYKMPKGMVGADYDAQLTGSNPDGIIRRGDCVLAVRSKAMCEEHREWLENLTQNQSGAKVAQSAAEELRQKSSAVAIDEGYED